MKTCPDCGCRVYEFGCVNCNEVAYIEWQTYLNNDSLPGLTVASPTPLDTGGTATSAESQADSTPRNWR